MYAQPAAKDRSCLKAFWIALATAAAIFIPIMIWDKGYFFFYGDFKDRKSVV